jgi:hypothetical protein
MGYPHDLLKAADEMLGIDPLTQATLRRAVSSAYYALFHLLIEDACRLWAEPNHRSKLARHFDHKRMKEASSIVAKTYAQSTDTYEQALAIVANTFVQMQQRRHECDYDLSITQSAFKASQDVFAVEFAFEMWGKISPEKIARDYLFSLLFRDRS